MTSLTDKPVDIYDFVQRVIANLCKHPGCVRKMETRIFQMIGVVYDFGFTVISQPNLGRPENSAWPGRLRIFRHVTKHGLRGVLNAATLFAIRLVTWTLEHGTEEKQTVHIRNQRVHFDYKSLAHESTPSQPREDEIAKCFEAPCYRPID